MLASEELKGRLEAVRARIEAAARRNSRDPDGIRLVAVSKEAGADLVRAVEAAGVRDFGENYVQELERKREAAPGATWHFLGRVQSNKARRVAELFGLVHTLEPGRAAERLALIGRERGRPVPGLVQVDLQGGRVGVAPEETERFVGRMQGSGGIEVRGLMTVAPLGAEPRVAFRAVRELRDRIRSRWPEVKELSMGMSSDLDAAIEEGATIVRVGSAIFGPRR